MPGAVDGAAINILNIPEETVVLQDDAMTGIEQNDYVFIKGGYNTNPKFNYPQLESSKFMGYSWHYKNETEATPIFNEFEFEMMFIENEKYDIGYNNELFIDAVKRNVKVYRNIVVEGKSTPNKVELDISKILVPEQTGLFDDGFMLLTLNIDGENKTFVPTNEDGEKYEWPKLNATPLSYFNYELNNDVIKLLGFADSTNIPSKLVMGESYKIDEFDIMAQEHPADWSEFPYFDGVDIIRCSKTLQSLNFNFNNNSGILVIPTASLSAAAFSDENRSFNVITSFTDEVDVSSFINFVKTSNNRVINIINNGDVRIVPNWAEFYSNQPKAHHTTFNIDINFEKNIENPGSMGDCVVGYWEDYQPGVEKYFNMTVNLIGVSYQDFADANATSMIDKMMGYPDIQVNFLPSQYERVYEDASINWEFTTNDETNTITLNKYVGANPNVVVRDGYAVANDDGETKIYNNVTLAESSNASGVFGRNSKIESVRFERGVKLNSESDFLFFVCRGIKSINFGGVDTSNVTSMVAFINKCSSLQNINIKNLDTSRVTTMQNAFSECSSLTSLDVSNLNTSRVTYMFGMFTSCPNLTSLDLSSFDTSRVTNMQNMFYSCSNLTSLDLSSFDTSRVTTMQGMFSGCSSLTSLDLSSFEIKETTKIDDMFANCNLLSTIYVKDEATKARIEASTNFPSTATVIVGSPA